jgi:hypothetical protein
LWSVKFAARFSGGYWNVCAWRVASRGPTAEKPIDLPQVTVRRASVAYNKHLRDAAKLDDFQRVTFHIDDEEHRIGLKFHNDAQDSNAYKVHFDGGSSGREGQTLRRKRIYATQCTHIINSTPWLKKISRLEEPVFRRFVARLDDRQGLWILQLRPSFEFKALTPEQIPSDAVGIYRYIHKDEVVYIGQGHIRSRARDGVRDHWDCDCIEYSVIDPEEARFRWEKEWLDLHQQRHSKLPRYNRVGGRS